MRKGELLTMGIISALLSLTGCNQKPAGQETKVTKENPPPKPPNCPDLPELANLRLKDGRIADVRIFRDGDETFYIPFSWYQYSARTFNSNLSPYNSEPGAYAPDVNEIECPGVVHVGAFNYTTPWIFRRANVAPDIPPNFSGESVIDKVRIPRRGSYDVLGTPDLMDFYNVKMNEDFFMWDSSLGRTKSGTIDVYFGTAQSIVWINGRGIFYEYELDREGAYNKVEPAWGNFRAKVIASDDWKLKRESVKSLYTWLKTPPKDRDNDRIFKLGVADL